MAGKAVAQVMYPYAGQVRLGLHFFPELANTADWTLGQLVPENRIGTAAPFQRRKKRARLVAESDSARADLAVVQEQSPALHLAPGEIHDLRHPTAGQQEQIDDHGVQRLRMDFPAQHLAQPSNLLIGEETLALPALVGPDVGARVAPFGAQMRARETWVMLRSPGTCLAIPIRAWQHRQTGWFRA